MRWLVVALMLAGCAEYTARTTRHPTAAETSAQQAFDACWNAGGAPTPTFFTQQEGGVLYAAIWGSSRAQVDAVAACVESKGVRPTWGIPPSHVGGQAPRR